MVTFDLHNVVCECSIQTFIWSRRLTKTGYFVMRRASLTGRVKECQGAGIGYVDVGDVGANRQGKDEDLVMKCPRSKQGRRAHYNNGHGASQLKGPNRTLQPRTT